MSLTSGTKLGPYQIQSPLGAGGMGEVYRARDTRLDRTVAIKILPEHLSSNAEARQRFDREARAISSLNHPNICTLYDVGHQDGIDYLVMEFLEGETLADRLAKGALPLEQVLKYGIEICDGLEKAHRTGVVHRDLKPGNIMLTKSGAKLMDFGLAKSTPAARPLSSSLTMTLSTPAGSHPLTAQGTVVGTFQYMSPEQVEGKDADTRSDIFALGAVLYEMATGKRAFEGKTVASVIAAVLERDPAPISSTKPMSPPALDRVVKVCLAKDPDQRWQSSADLGRELTWIREDAALPRAQPGKRQARRWQFIAALIAIASVVALGLVGLRNPQTTAKLVRFTIVPGENGSLIADEAVVSPDGTQIAFAATDTTGKQQLWVRALDSLSLRRLPETEGAAMLFWSPDSRHIGFFADSKIKTVALAGGPTRVLADAAGDPRGGNWGTGGTILFAPNWTSGLYRIAPDGTGLKAVTNPADSHDVSHRFPWFLPDGQHFLFYTMSDSPDHSGVYLGSLDGTTPKKLLSSDSAAQYAPPGYVVYVHDHSLLAQPVDAARLELKGEPQVLAEEVWQPTEAQALPTFSVSQSGVITYRSGSAAVHLQWFTRSGVAGEEVGPPAGYGEPALSPDGKRLAITVDGGAIWVFDLARKVGSPATVDRGYAPVWSPDGRQLVFSAARSGPSNLYLQDATDSSSEKLLLQTGTTKNAADWSRDGRYVVYDDFVASNQNAGISVLPLFGDRKPFAFRATRFNESEGRFSPDGRWMLYSSDETGRPEIYIRPFPSGSSKWQVSLNGGGQPLWRSDGKEIFYIAPDRKLMAAPINVSKSGDAIEAGAPVALFQTQISSLKFGRNFYVVSNDGQRFLVLTRKESSPVNVVLNVESLKR